jgi:L,D-peptidoglycan transpeptidase YkuD (ErfK/YbiS/YcfS/YnhG family)
VIPADLVVTPWAVRFMGRSFPVSIGRGGISEKKREGDGATPVGTHRIVGVLYRPDRLSSARLPAWAEPIGLRDIWSDDPRDPAYNLRGVSPCEYSHENLRRADPLYDVVILTDWNWPDAKPGRGSAIFLHQWRRPGFPTEGCIAFSREHLLWIVGQIVPGTRVIVRG